MTAAVKRAEKEDDLPFVRTIVALPQRVIENAIRSYLSKSGIPAPLRISFHGGSTDEGETPVTAEFEIDTDGDLVERLRML